MNLPDERKTLAAYAFAHASATPDRLAMTGPHERVTYLDLSKKIIYLCGVLKNLGIERGDRIAVLTTARCDAFALFLAVNEMGGVWVGLNPRYKIREIKYVINDCRPRVMFHIAEYRGRAYQKEIDQLISQCESIKLTINLDDDKFSFAVAAESAERFPYERSENPNMAEEPAILVYTSGTTGEPKGVLISNRSMIRRSITQIARLPMNDYPRVYNAYPMNHIGGLHWVASYAVIAGGTICFRESFDPDELLDLLDREKINVLQLFPTMYMQLVGAPTFLPDKLRSVKWHHFSGASIGSGLLHQLSGLGGKLVTSYGMSESCGSVTYSDPDLDIDILCDTIGRPVPDGEVRVVDDAQRDCTKGSTGEIWVRADFAMLGYLDRPKETAECMNDGWIKTGDLALVLNDGHLRFVGRRSEMFKSGGFNVYPREIELIIESHAGVEMSAVVRSPHPLFGEVGVAFVFPKIGAVITEEAIGSWCREHLADFKVPKAFRVVEKLPLLAVGKVDKSALRNQVTELFQTTEMKT